jgi:ubiquitin-protein ligase
MSPRARRLYADHNAMVDLAARGETEFRCEGNPPEEYQVAFHRKGLCRDATGDLAVRHLHRARIQLHLDYPRLPPVVTWQTPIFHPNILPPERHGGVCIGAWSASESLADLCDRLGRMIAYESFNVADALDGEAAQWAREAGLGEGDDLETALVRLSLH